METIFYIKTRSPKNYKIIDGKLFYVFKETFDEDGESIFNDSVKSYFINVIVEELIKNQHLYKTTDDFISGILKSQNLIKEDDSKEIIKRKKEKIDKVIDFLIDKKIITVIRKLKNDKFYQSKILKNVFLKTPYTLKYEDDKF